MTIQHEYLVMALHEAKARDYEREAAEARLAREARAGRPTWWQRLLGRRPAPAPEAPPRAVPTPRADCRPAVAR